MCVRRERSNAHVAFVRRTTTTNIGPWIPRAHEDLHSSINGDKGSPTHWAVIDRIQAQLEQLGLEIQCDDLKFTYYDGPLSEPSIHINGESVPVTSYSKYSGFTDADGVSGQLVDLTTSSLTQMPDWKKASGNIALTNITNLAYDLPDLLPVWPGSPPWEVQYGSPEVNAEVLVHNLTVAADAGVKAVIYAWQNASTGLVEGQWVPFHNLYQGVPTLFVQGEYGGLEKLQQATSDGAEAQVTLEAQMQPGRTARTLWTVIPGTDLKNESVILNTHTDGTNLIEENGYIALLAYAAELVANPPRRTTVLLFVGQHMHFEAFAQAPQRATSRWLNQHPEYWAGEGQRHAFGYGGQLKGVVGSCVEHLGAVHWDESVEDDRWFATEQMEPELLYASTPELNRLLREQWVGAEPNVTRVSNPVDSEGPQAGEGYPFYLVAIPNISLVTNPSYLLKIWPHSFDEKRLMDLHATRRQIDSFFRVWKGMDMMSAEEMGVQSSNGTQQALHV
ncbi:uncharacterized protein LTR77_001310 [Saxophila tyrrhenica]|uniref:Uncharacterized protein n=1 Tax=Saxophila tyrrhenica TaxID=1690608 RepID=A0AAV9PKP5_9PEZI|nr:hypothetical protein LTR77_001310 [Saxophila tyrrhenica]